MGGPGGDRESVPLRSGVENAQEFLAFVAESGVQRRGRWRSASGPLSSPEGMLKTQL